MEEPLRVLRSVRDELRKVPAMMSLRERAIREAVKEGRSQRRIAQAAGLSQSRVNRIARQGERRRGAP